MAGAASGLFVAALVGTSHSALTNQAFLLLMMIGGAVGFYLGIDTPPHPLTASNSEPANGAWVGKIDTPELLSAIGTFLAAFSAFVVMLPYWSYTNDRPDVAVTWSTRSKVNVEAPAVRRLPSRSYS